eukprot:TRINITY_DN22332_c0_g1_i1.p1 TRINITY_DN22332_c0_g1~~TRINITY_DN22332_c0_g1_i1.p1  ORF type:complete len:351 (+),score=52.50 TRINITY_DN22332_c0_g1_i1:97-1149(+)
MAAAPSVSVQHWHRVTTYNCLSLAREGRALDIYRQLHRSTAVLLQGTRHNARDRPLQTILTDNYRRFIFGYNRRSNKHAGVEIGIKRQHCDDRHIAGVSWPTDPALAGRGGAVRVRTPNTDTTYINIYMPPNNTAQTVARRLMDWLAQLVNSLPNRTTVIIGMDGNARLGKTEAGIVEGNEHVGIHAADRENENGTMLRDFAEQNGFSIINTLDKHSAEQPTFYSATGKFASRIDYLLIPTEMYQAKCYRAVEVDTRSGDRLQLIEVARRADHSPLTAAIKLNLEYQGRTKRLRWDRDAIINMMYNGVDKQSFLDKVNANLLTPEFTAKWIQATEFSSKPSFTRLTTPAE